MSPIEEGRLYKLEGRGMIRHYAEAIILLGLLGIGIYGVFGLLIYGINNFTLNNWGVFLFLFAGDIFILWLFYCSIFYCNHGIITRETAIGLNAYRIKLGELRFDEIDEIYNKWKSFDIVVKDIFRKKLVLNTSIQPTEEFFNEIIRRAVNCRRIDLRYIRKRYKNLLIYEKGIIEY